MNKRIPVLQICHSYDAPFEMVADFYASLFSVNKFELTTIFLKGEEKSMMPAISTGRSLFYKLSSADLKGAKSALTKRVATEIQTGDYKIIIAHRNKSICVMCAAAPKDSDCILIGVAHAYDVFKNLSRKWLAWKNRKRLHLIGVSDAIRDNILQHTKPLGLTSVHNLANCLDIEKFQQNLLTREDARKRLKLASDEYIIGSVGRLHPDKDFHTLIRAFALAKEQLPAKSRLLIMGSGRQETELKQLTKELNCGDSITFAGQVSEGYRLFKAFDLFALSSAVEPFGMVLIEAICAEVPVISSSSGGAQQVLAEKELLFPIGDSKKCSELLLKCSEWPEAEVNKSCKNALSKTTDNFSTDAFYQSFWNFPPLEKYAQVNADTLFLVIKDQKINLDTYYHAICEQVGNVDLRRLSSAEQDDLPTYFKKNVNIPQYKNIIFFLRFKKEIAQVEFIKTIPNLIILEHDACQNYIEGWKYQGKFSNHYRQLPQTKIFVSGYQITKKLQSEGFNAHFVPKGYDNKALVDFNNKRDIEVGFIGSLESKVYNGRKNFLEQIQLKLPEMQILKTAPGEDYCTALNRIKYFLSADIGLGEYMIKNFEAMACGCILLTYDQGEQENAALGFEDMKNVVLYKDTAELEEKLNTLKKDSDLSKNIRQQGKELAQSQWTWTNAAKIFANSLTETKR